MSGHLAHLRGVCHTGFVTGEGDLRRLALQMAAWVETCPELGENPTENVA